MSSVDPTAARFRSDKVCVECPAAGVMRLTISNPNRRNALDRNLLEALADQVRSTTAKCLIIRGADDVFCSGYDLAELSSERFERDAEELIAHPHHALFDALEHCRAAVIAELNGTALGGGLELAICCDLRFASEDATLGMPAGHLGLIYSYTGLRRFVEVCGLAATKELFLLGRRVSAKRADRLGIVTGVFPAAQLEQEVLAAATEVAARAPLAQAGNKRILEELRAASRELSPRLEQELTALRHSCFVSSDLREGIRAFAERRDPTWIGS